tara:strand:+ start:1291 stop:1395 length:105 start_codon:yes stop_codon:yes gene_type:complete
MRDERSEYRRDERSGYKRVERCEYGGKRELSTEG